MVSQYINSKTKKSVNNHFLIVQKNEKIGDYILFQSYDTIVGIYLMDYSKLITNTNKYSNTTSKHLKDFISTLNYKIMVEFAENEFNGYIENWIK